MQAKQQTRFWYPSVGLPWYPEKNTLKQHSYCAAIVIPNALTQALFTTFPRSLKVMSMQPT